MTVRDDKVQLVQRLLAKAESTTPEEAEALTEAATRLMVKWQIEDAELQVGEEPSVETVTVMLRLDGRRYVATYGRVIVAALSNAVEAFGTVATFMNFSRLSKKATAMSIVGAPEDAEHLLALAESLLVQLTRALGRFRGSSTAGAWASDADRRAERRAFIFGFGDGVASKVRDQLDRALETAAMGTDLVLRGKLVRAKQALPNDLREPLPLGEFGTEDAYAEGRASGRRAELRVSA